MQLVETNVLVLILNYRAEASFIQLKATLQ
jgi:hypothetical protein